MAHLLSLPTELIQNIAIDLGEDVKVLRLVCVPLDIALSHLVLSCVKISFVLFEEEKTMDTLDYLERSTALSSSCTRIKILFMGVLSSESSCDVINRKIANFITRLVNLRSMEYAATSDIPEEIAVNILRSIQDLPNLAELCFRGFSSQPPPRVSLPCILERPTKLTISSCENGWSMFNSVLARLPSIHDLTIANISGVDLTVLLKDLQPSFSLYSLTAASIYWDTVTLSHLSQIKHVHIKHTPSIIADASWWSALRSHNIRLQTLTVNSVTESTLSYLNSYKGLTRLSVNNIGYANTRSPPPTQEFFASTLPAHSSTLGVLSIDTSCADEWCLSKAFAKSITTAFPVLHTLSIKVNQTDVSWRDTVVSLLDTAILSRGALRSLTLSPARPYHMSMLNNRRICATALLQGWNLTKNFGLKDLLQSYQHRGNVDAHLTVYIEDEHDMFVLEKSGDCLRFAVLPTSK